VSVTGSDETVENVGKRVRPGIRFLGYGHRVSFGYITGQALSGFAVQRLVENAATDLTAWNQRGCLSPQAFYLENNGRVGPEQFAEMLAVELSKREKTDPRGSIPTEAAAAIARRRAFYQVRAADSPDTRLWCSEGSTSWTIVYEADPAFQFSCLNRFVYIKSVANLGEALHGAGRIRGQVSTVGLGAVEAEAHPVALELTRWGAMRICPIGQMQNPPLSWRHDGRPPLGDLVTWTDWEMS
jgi:hypothetical protein